MKRKNVIILVLAVLLLISLLTACGSNVTFKIDFIVDGDVYHTVDSKGNEEIKMPPDPTKDGAIFDGWYWDKDTWEKPFTANSLLNAPLSENMSVYAKWKTEGENEVQTYTITFNSNGGGDISAITKEAGESITEPTEPTKVGYSFDGWFIDNETFANEYIFSTMPAESFTLYAKWTINQYTISFNSNGGSNVTAITKEAGESITAPTTPTKTGYTFDGWYIDNNTFQNEYVFGTTTEQSFTLYAKWIKNNQGQQGVYQRINASGALRSNGNYILFGEYPQTIKEHSVTLNTTTDSRGYYLGSDGFNYAKVTARLYGSSNKFSNNATVTSGTVYYFKVEPIKWRILEESGGTVLILCESIIAKKSYNSSSSNNYMISEIRAWLNNEFYNTAFNALQKELIQITNVDNSVYSTGYSSNQYACANTNDKIFLPSYREMVNTTYGFSSDENTADTARQRITSDYTRTITPFVDTNTEYYGNGVWLLRSPDNYNHSSLVRRISSDGTANGRGNGEDIRYGIVPALKIRMEDNQGQQGVYQRINSSGVPTASGNYILFGEYPQTIKENSVTIGTTADSRGYYLGSDGYYYSKVTATPNENGYKFSTGTTVSNGAVYYFKVESIKWRILEESGGTALILCESIIANKRYAASSNNYMNSEIRAWLNNEFYSTAFTALQQELIQITNVDNSVYSTGYSSNSYACANTNDKIFLPSYRDMVNTVYGFSSSNEGNDAAKHRATSDYSRATGVCMVTDTVYYGNGNWWLRSPDSSNSSRARSIDDYGYSYYYHVNRTYYGVVPALKIRLSSTPQPVTYTITFNSNGGGDVVAITKEAGENITEPTVPTKLGYTFDGWYTDNDTFANEYTFSTMPEESFTLYAKWVEDNQGQQGVYQRINASGDPTANGNYILFGEYPQTIKANSVTVGTTANAKGYYLGSDDCYYAKVTATPYNSGYRFSTNATISSGIVYYFKVEPIKWRILTESRGTALILCESIIANKRYDEDSNNYMNSEIRAWLNDEFYNKAFTALQQELIQITEVDNSVYSTGDSSNPYTCANTNDKIFLPSYREMVNTAYGFSSDYTAYDTARRRLTSDYSRATGVWMSTNTTYYGNGCWWLRSPYFYDSDDARYVTIGGSLGSSINVNYTYYGVVPALVIDLR